MHNYEWQWMESARGYGIHTFDRICGPGAEPNEANEAPNEADDQQAAKRETGYP